MSVFTCTECSFSINENSFQEGDLSCPHCGNRLEETSTREKKEIAEEISLPQQEPQHHKLEFSGAAGEYFRIWIVNLFLTIITLGIYGAWAKVRTRKYFYAHTKLADNSFDYLANPIAILKGNLIIAGGLILYNFANVFTTYVSAGVGIIFYVALPFLIYKSLRFYAHNSAFRNIRFRFLGTLKEGYKTYLLFPLLIPLTLGAITPYWAFRRKKYFFDNFAFGTTTNSFEGRTKPFYGFYLKGTLMFFGFMVIASIIIFGTGFGAFFDSSMKVNQGTTNKAALLIKFFTMYFAVLIVFTFVQQYLYTRLTNYCWEHSRLGTIKFQSTIQARRLLWIRLTNILAILFSLGLLIPWAKVRRTRYILDNLTVISDQSLDNFSAAAESDISAIGDSATDFFDFEIGL